MVAEWSVSLSASAICGMLVLAVYCTTISSGIPGGDSGELVTEACHLGTAHPPGYPLLTLLMHAFINAVRVGKVAFRANLLSAVLSSSALVLLGKTGSLKVSMHHDESM
jgi:hypothetical protein